MTVSLYKQEAGIVKHDLRMTYVNRRFILVLLFRDQMLRCNGRITLRSGFPPCVFWGRSSS